mmetsp:Transcript_138236/g.257984  ORF Transcript_138236/g.257984 Transcript_138236/m.257984 type:complete len:380 (+) Transcript_138236:31-1170(+)
MNFSICWTMPASRRCLIKVVLLLSAVADAHQVQQNAKCKNEPSRALSRLLQALQPAFAFSLPKPGRLSAASQPTLAALHPMVNLRPHSRVEMAESRKYHITEVEAEVIAKNFREMYDIPLLPNPLERVVVKQMIVQLDKLYPLVLDDDTYMSLIGDRQKWDEVQEAVIKDLNDRIDLPIISKELQDDICEKICSIIFTSATAKKVRRKMFFRATRDVFNTDKKQLATEFNEKLDIPLVAEKTEQWIAEKMIDVMFGVINTVLPDELIDLLQSTTPEELAVVRQNLIETVNAKIDIPFRDEEQEKKAITAVVDFFLKRWGLFEIEVLTPEEQVKALQFKLDCIEVELDAAETVFTQKKEAFLTQKTSHEAKLAALGAKPE